MANPKDFERYFGDRASLAESLFGDGWREEAYLVATVVLDSMASIWRHDTARGALPVQTPIPGPPALRMNALLDTFAPSDEYAPKVAVVLFAEDMQRLRPDLAPIARRLLARRLEDQDAPEPMRFRASPKAYLDCSPRELAQEAPELDKTLIQLAEHYRYPAFGYRFLRSSTVHAALRGARVNRFAGTEPSAGVDYFPAWADGGRVRPISLGIGLAVVTRWVRTVVGEYVKRCPTPAVGFEPSRDAQVRLDALWTKSK